MCVQIAHLKQETHSSTIRNVINPSSACPLIVHDKGKITALRLYLNFIGQTRITGEEKCNTLRHDADASKRFPKKIECIGCKKVIRVVGASNGGTDSRLLAQA